MKVCTTWPLTRPTSIKATNVSACLASFWQGIRNSRNGALMRVLFGCGCALYLRKVDRSKCSFTATKAGFLHHGMCISPTDGPPAWIAHRIGRNEQHPKLGSFSSIVNRISSILLGCSPRRDVCQHPSFTIPLNGRRPVGPVRRAHRDRTIGHSGRIGKGVPQERAASFETALSHGAQVGEVPVTSRSGGAWSCGRSL